MNKHYVFIAGMIIFCNWNCSSITRITRVDKVFIYKQFLINASTNDAIYTFKNPQNRKVDFDENHEYKIKPEDFLLLLNRASKVKKHIQQKMGGITLAGEFHEGNRLHYFLYFDEAKIIIDMTDRIEYWINDRLNSISLK